MALISFNNHYSGKVDHSWNGTMPINPPRCIEEMINFFLACQLDKETVHTIVMPGVREGLVLTAYHAIMGHFPNVMYSMRDKQTQKYNWIEIRLQDWRDEARARR